MREPIEERAQHLALYMIENQTTVRGAAAKFGISKSTVHADATKANRYQGKENTAAHPGSRQTGPRGCGVFCHSLCFPNNE